MSGTILLALHYQNEVLHANGKIRVGVAEGSTQRETVIANAKRLLAGARANGVAIVHVRIAFRPDHKDVLQNAPIFRNIVKIGALREGSWGAEFLEGLGPLPEELIVKHSRVNAFYGSALEEAVNLYRPSTLVCSGVATNYVVEHTARHASDMGYQVVVVGDACSSGDPALHDATLRNLALVATVETTEQTLRRFASKKGA
jgi:biuret amidohydrolase